MKMIIASLLLCSLPAFADTSEVVKGTALIDVHELNCTVRAGGEGELAQRLNTILGDAKADHPIVRNTKLLELRHESAFAPGCDLARLDTISKRAMGFFGFIHGAAIEVTKTTDGARKTGDGRCVTTYIESVKIDLGEGVSVVSEEGELRNTQGCR